MGFEEEATKMEEGLGKSLKGKIGLIFTFVTLLCMANMLMVSKTQDMRDVLGNANLKFLGVRLVLLIAQIQPQVLGAVTKGSALYEKLGQKVVPVVAEKFPKWPVEKYFSYWTFTELQAELAHVCLLNVEGLIVVIVTLMFWRLTEDQQEKLIAHDSRAIPEVGQRNARARELSNDPRVEVVMDDGRSSVQYHLLA